MQTQSILLLSSVSRQSGKPNLVGRRQKSGGYYLSGSGQSVSIDLPGSITGIIDIQGSLLENPVNDLDWFSIEKITNPTATITNSYYGNFSWIRVVITGFTAGTINKITLTY